MNEENNNVVPNDRAINDTEIKKDDIINNYGVASVNDEPTENSHDASVIAVKDPKHNEDVSKIKIRTILKQRFKKSNSIFKIGIPLLIVGIICFGAGLIAGKELDRHNNRNVLMNKNGIYRQLPNRKFNGGNFNKRQFNNNNKQQQSITPPATNNQQQSTTPPATNNQSQ